MRSCVLAIAAKVCYNTSMFGYIQPDKGELKLKQLTRYRAHYCALCKSMGKNYSQKARLVLNYDCAFFALVLCGMVGGAGCRAMRCAYKPFKKPFAVVEANLASDFAAGLNIALMWNKLGDDKADEHGAPRLAACVSRAVLHGDYICVQKNMPELCSAVESGLAALIKIEREHKAELDAPAAAFAQMLYSAAMCAPVPDVARKKAFAAMCAGLGRWVYLIDAWDDRAKDAQSGAYNPFNIASASGADEAELKQRAEIMLYNSLAEAQNAFLLLRPHEDEAIIENILTLGCPGQTRRILGGEND